MAEQFKKVKIHTGVVKRIYKEKAMYQKQHEAEMVKVQAMKDRCAADDEELKAVIRKQEEVANETKAMGPDGERRLREGVDTLKNYMMDIKEPESEWSEDKQEIMKNAREVLTLVGAK